MARDKRKRVDGTDIDPVADLAEFVQSFGASEEPATETPDETQAEPKKPVQIAAPAEEDEFVGKTPEEIRAAAKEARIAVRERERDLLNARNDLDRVRLEGTVRKVVAEQHPATPATPQPPPVDPREALIQEKWFTEPAEAQRLMREMADERIEQRLATARTEITSSISAAEQEKQRAAQGNYAFQESMRQLRAAGVPEADLNDRRKIGAVYMNITLRPTAEQPNPYYTSGGPLNPEVIVQAYKDLFGVPSNGATTQQAPPPEPRQSPAIVAPPGSSRPAPAAAPQGKSRATPLTADMQRDLTHTAESLGVDPAKLIARRRARIERESQRNQ